MPPPDVAAGPGPSFLKRFVQSWRGGLVGAVLAVGVGLAVYRLSLGLALIYWSYDLPFYLRGVLPADEVVMIYLDEDSHDKLAQSRTEPWSRGLHARLVRRLTAAGARLIVFDVTFSDRGRDAADDEALARAMQAHGRVLLAADVTQPAAGTPTLGRVVTPPYSLLRDAAAGFGSAETVPSYDFTIREHFHGHPDDLQPSLAWESARLAGSRFATNETERFRERWINYYGAPGTLQSFSYHRALDPDATRDAAFRNKFVFVGAKLLTRYAGERKDEYRNPWSYWMREGRFMAGVEVQAMTFLNLLRGDWLRRWPRSAEWPILLATGLLAGFCLFQLRPVAAALSASLAILLTTALAYSLFAVRLTWFPWLVVVLQIALATFGSVVFNSIRLYIQKRLYEQTLGLYLSPKLVKKFSSNPKFLKPGAEKQTLTVMFTDIANFTSISEGMDSDELAKVMNQYFQKAVNDCVHSTDGTVVKYIGDAIFAFWNAPEAQVDHQLRACHAAIAFAREEPMQMNGQVLLTRIGLHTGTANVGNFGSTERVDYTALGESINLASRMEGLNKYLGTIALATGDTIRGVSDRILTRCCGQFRLKGFEKAVEVHELVGTTDEAAASAPWRDVFAQALEHFRRREFEKAAAAFRVTIERHPGDGPAKFYLHRLEEMQQHPPPDDWPGDVELKEK